MNTHAIRDSVTVKPEPPPPATGPGLHHVGLGTGGAYHSVTGTTRPDLNLDTTTESSPQNDGHHNGSAGPGSTASPAAERGDRPSKIAACLSCRRKKVRCEKGPTELQCRRCHQNGSDCVRPRFNVGRRKGVKNKRKGLEKAVFQVEEALKRAGSSMSTDVYKALVELRAMSANGQDAQLNGSNDNHHGSHKRPRLATAAGSSAGDQEDYDDDSSDEDEEEEEEHSPHGCRKESVTGSRGPLARDRLRRDSAFSPPQRGVFGSGSSGGGAAARKPEERLAVDDAENPLQLLARASNLHQSPTSGPSPGMVTASLPGPARSRQRAGVDGPETSRVEAFFGTTNFNIDQGDDYDPIDIGLVTVEEAEKLFDFFHDNLSHTRWGLDRKLYTAPWTRTRSPFLFTTIMSASALFITEAAALSKRLSRHVKTLAHRVIQKRHRSAEIVLAFMINVPWLGPGVHSTDDETCWYVAMATTIAIDLQMGKLSLSGDAFHSGSTGDLTPQDCIDPALALRSGGFSEDANSEMGMRLVRRRERCWIALFVLERGMCLARGRSYTLPMTSLIRRVDKWHESEIADTMDGALVSMAVLRRDLDQVFDKIRTLCKDSREAGEDGSVTAQKIQSMVDNFFEDWRLQWGETISQENRIPPYVEILISHTRLSVYSSVINTPTAPVEVRQFFRTASLTAAVNVMRAAVQGEQQLFSMPNNTAIMVSFAACFALGLSTHFAAASSTAALAPSVRSLIEELSDVLMRIGNYTPHRNGMCGLYAKYLRILVGKAAAETGAATARGLGSARLRGGQERQAYVDAGLASSSARLTHYGNGNASRNAHSNGNGTPTPGLNAVGGFTVPPPPSVLPGLEPYQPAGSTSGWGSVRGGELISFSSMSQDEIIAALTRSEFDAGGGGGGGGGGAFGTVPGGAQGDGNNGFGWDDGGTSDFLPSWGMGQWTDFGFQG